MIRENLQHIDEFNAKTALAGAMLGLTAATASPMGMKDAPINPAITQSVEKEAPLSDVIDLPEKEKLIISKVAKQYGLNAEQTLLLYVIRKIEHGGLGREFGVLNRTAMRFKHDPERSFITQAKWAAGTIKKNFYGDLQSFADKYAPIGAQNDPHGKNKNWYNNAIHYMNLWSNNETVNPELDTIKDKLPSTGYNNNFLLRIT